MSIKRHTTNLFSSKYSEWKILDIIVIHSSVSPEDSAIRNVGLYHEKYLSCNIAGGSFWRRCEVSFLQIYAPDKENSNRTRKNVHSHSRVATSDLKPYVIPWFVHLLLFSWFFSSYPFGFTHFFRLPLILTSYFHVLSHGDECRHIWEKTKVHSNEEEKNQQGRKQTNTKNRRYIRVKQMVCILTNRSSWLLCIQREKKTPTEEQRHFSRRFIKRLWWTWFTHVIYWISISVLIKFQWFACHKCDVGTFQSSNA